MKTRYPQSHTLVSLAMVLAFFTFVAGCHIGKPIEVSLAPEVDVPQQKAIILLADGLDPDIVHKGVEEGWLPNIEKRFADSGIEVENAITTVPSITYAAITSILTGTTPQQHHIMGNWWFERDKRLFRNYATIKHYRDVNDDFAVPTLYERIVPDKSASVQAAHMRGVTDNHANWARSGLRWFIGRYVGVDKLTASTMTNIIQEANGTGQWPALITLYAPGIDAVGHAHGVNSTQYREAVESFDHQVGRVCNWLQREGHLHDTTLILMSDHGHVPVDHKIDLMRLFKRDWHLNVTDAVLQDQSIQQRARFYDRYDAVAVYHSGRRLALHLAGNAGWDELPSPKAVHGILTAPATPDQLWNLEGMQLVTYLASEHSAIVRNVNGQGMIEQRCIDGEREYRYIPLPGDPLGYMNDPQLAAFVKQGFHNDRDWLAATVKQQIPDIVPHLVGLLNAPRGGQVLAFPEPGYAFTDQNGGHGGIDRDEMCSTFYVAGPGFPAGGTIPFARIVDVAPTLLTVLDKNFLDDDVIVGLPLRMIEGEPKVYGK